MTCLKSWQSLEQIISLMNYAATRINGIKEATKENNNNIELIFYAMPIKVSLFKIII